MEEKKKNQSYRHFFRMLWGFIGLYTVVNVVAVVFVALVITRRVRVRGYFKVWRQVMRGNVIISSNHPSALETLLIPVLFWPLQLVFPHLFAWSVARYDAFPASMRWLYRPFRCLLVGTSGHGQEIEQAMSAVLEHKGILVCYPEATRTCNARRHWEQDGKRMGVFRSGLPRLAVRCKSLIIPAWVDFGDVGTALTFGECVKRIITTCPMTISFGTPYQADGEMGGIELADVLKSRMFEA